MVILRFGKGPGWVSRVDSNERGAGSIPLPPLRVEPLS